jgi:altronate dehydratase
MGTPDQAADTDRRLLLLSDKDNVCVAVAALQAGECVFFRGKPIEILNHVPMAHKIAVRPIAEGETVVKYGASIGLASRAVVVGEHVHTHNLKSNYFPTFTHGGCGTGILPVKIHGQDAHATLEKF